MNQTLVQFWPAIDRVLRGQRYAGDKAQRPTIRLVILSICLFGFAYGLVMGSYGWMTGGRTLAETGLQMFFSAIKVPLLLLATFLISLPSFFVLNTLLGLRRELGEAISNIIGAQATLSIILASFAPLTCLWYLSATHSSLTYRLAILLNAVLFGIASVSSQLALRRTYRPLISSNRLHGWMLWSWTLVYAVVGIQMGWILRPFIGQPEMDVSFMRSDTWGNAYLKVFGLVRSIIAT